MEMKLLGTFQVTEHCVLKSFQEAIHFPSQKKLPGPTFALVVSELTQLQHQEMDSLLPT